MTNDRARRLRQHNGELRGGARYTARWAPRWSFYLQVWGFRCRREALQFEWAFKRALRRHRRGGRTCPWTALRKLCGQQRWTRQAPPSARRPLVVYHGFGPEDADGYGDGEDAGPGGWWPPWVLVLPDPIT